MSRDPRLIALKALHRVKQLPQVAVGAFLLKGFQASQFCRETSGSAQRLDSHNAHKTLEFSLQTLSRPTACHFKRIHTVGPIRSIDTVV
jgi:hypothetical protein